MRKLWIQKLTKFGYKRLYSLVMAKSEESNQRPSSIESLLILFEQSSAESDMQSVDCYLSHNHNTGSGRISLNRDKQVWSEVN